MADTDTGKEPEMGGVAPAQESRAALIVAVGLRLVFTAVWLVVMVASLSFADDGRYAWAVGGAVACVVTIPLAGRGSWREQAALSAVLLCCLIGLAAGVVCYFALFRFAWFESVFNDKGSGPLGLIVFAISGLAAGGWIAERVGRRWM